MMSPCTSDSKPGKRAFCSRAMRSDWMIGSSLSPKRSPGMMVGMPGGYGTSMVAAMRPLICSMSTRSISPLTRWL